MKQYLVTDVNKKSTRNIILTSENSFTLDDKEGGFEHKFLSDSTLFIRMNGKNYMFNKVSEEEGIYEINVGGQHNILTCKNEMDILKENFTGNGNSRKKAANILSPMPGAVVKIIAVEGTSVKKGDVLIVLEAMKMENEIKAHANCTIKAIPVKEKQTVEKGQLLIELAFG